MRWLILAVLAVFATSGDADAQAFKPRGGSKAAPAKKSAPAKKAAPAKKKAAAPAKKASTKKTSRAAETSARPDDLTPDEEDAPPTRGNDEDGDNYVMIEDD